MRAVNWTGYIGSERTGKDFPLILPGKHVYILYIKAASLLLISPVVPQEIENKTF